ncbi:MAG TPA: hypothetical protein VG860_03540 [Terriglobia bacterium]|jgi:hypothetical protein|nr:hypothetical protein [Terriglobia bacterium]
MRTVGEFVVGLLKMGLLAAGVLYAVEVLVAYLRLGDHLRPEFDSSKPLRSATRWSVWAGVVATDLVVRLFQPMVNMLSEASADVGEWAIARRDAHVPTRGQ